MREFLVFLELATTVWEKGGNASVPPKVAAQVYDALEALRSQLASIAARVISQEALQTIRDLASQWHLANPQRTYVAFVRFSDLGNEGQRRIADTEIRTRGLLAPMSEAARQVEQLRFVSERAIFLANHMPILLEWQGNLLFEKALATPDVQDLLGNVSKFTDSAADIGNDLDRMVALISAERVAALDHLAEVIEEQRGAMLNDFVLRLDESGSRFTQGLENSADRLLPLSTQVSSSLSDIRVILELLNETGGGVANDEPLDLIALEAAFDSAATLTGRVSSLVTELEKLLQAESNAGTMTRLDDLLQKQERRIFLYLVFLVLLVSVCVIAVTLVLRKRPSLAS